MSLRVSKEGIKILDRAKQRKGWNRQSKEWYTSAGSTLTKLKDVWAEKPVPRSDFQALCNPVGVDWREVVDYETSSPEDLEPIKFWEGVPDVSTFHGRTEDLKNLKDWIVKDKCRLLAIHGIRGIGKTALTVKLTEEISPQFDYVIWYSLASSPLLEEFLTDICKFLGCHSDFDFPKNIPNINDRISQLIRFLNRYRCLLVLDRLETLLVSGKLSGKYAGLYQDRHLIYGDLMRRLGEEQHKSCFIVTTCAITREIALLEETDKFVRTHRLEGLGEEARGIFQEHRLLDENKWQKLSNSYRGNPLLLKIISSYISEMFSGGVDTFLRQGTLVIGKIETFLEQIFEHLSDLEQNILYNLAEQNEIVSFDQLREILRISPNQLLLALESLVMRRSLVEKTTSSSQSPDGFTLAPVIKEYVLKRTHTT